MSIKKQLLKLIVIPLLLAPFAASADPSYSLTILPSNFSANGLGENGLVIGASHETDHWHTATWSQGAVTIYPDEFGSINAVSRNGMMTGRTYTINGESPYIFADGHFTDLGNSGFGDSEGRAINSAGQVAIAVNGPTYNAVLLYSNGVTTWIDVLGGDHAMPVDINEAGAIVGYSEAGHNEGGVHAFMYANGVATNLGLPGSSYATAINDAGQVVGFYYNDEQGPFHGFLYAQGTITELDWAGYLSSSAEDINNAGQIVGSVFDSNGGPHPYLLSDGKMTDLNSLVTGVPGWTITGAEHINDAGEILAYACQVDGNCAEALLTPLSAVPEPASWALLFCGIFMLAARRKLGH